MTNSVVVACPKCGTKNRVPIIAGGRPRCGSCKADVPWVVPATDADFAAAIDSPGVVLVDLWAPWCGPCRMVAPVLEKLAARYAGTLKVVKVNVDDCPRTAAIHDARSIPTLLVMVNGQVVERIVGAQPEPVLARAIDAAQATRT
jgi:thioredoxin 2